jgi:hypothetical protein
MKVEFEIEEVWTMFNSVLDELVALPGVKKDRKDLAALRRWRTEEMSPGSDGMKILTEKVNREIQREHERSEVSPIKKPDWL